MSGLQDAGRMLEGAEQAARAGDFESADELLRGAARIQEAELGPLHPDLANTLNNLAIASEKTGRLNDAETFYRRAVAIAAASLPVGHPKIAASRENLEAFCRARGLPVEIPEATTPTAPEAAAAPDPAAAEPDRPAAQPAPVEAAEAAPVPRAARPKIDSPAAVARPQGPVQPAGPTHRPQPPEPRGDLRRLAGVAFVVIAAVALLVWRPWSARETPAPAPAAAVTGPRAEAPAVAEPPARTTPGEETPRQAIASRPESAGGPANQRAASSAATLAAVQLCQTFSTSGGSWQCDPAGTQVSPGRVVLYTRVRSASDGMVVHHWYHGETLVQSVRLSTQANTSEGYRTYSRQTVEGGDWRVEVRSATGDSLHEQRFTVR